MTSTNTRRTPTYQPMNNSSKATVANYLLDHVGEWIDTSDFDTIGVNSGSRRMRELRENGWQIQSRRAPGSRTRQHRLAKAPVKAVQAKYRTVKQATSR